MGVTQAKSWMNAEDARKCVQILLEDPAFQVLHGRLGGVELYRSFIDIAERRQNDPRRAIKGLVYFSRICEAIELFHYEANQKRLEHPTDGEPVTSKTEHGSLEVLVGGGAAAGGDTIHLPYGTGDTVHYAN